MGAPALVPQLNNSSQPECRLDSFSQLSLFRELRGSFILVGHPSPGTWEAELGQALMRWPGLEDPGPRAFQHLLLQSSVKCRHGDEMQPWSSHERLIESADVSGSDLYGVSNICFWLEGFLAHV